MATVQHLERLHALHRSFSSESGLEGCVVGQRLQRLLGRAEAQQRRRAFLRDARRTLRAMVEYSEQAEGHIKRMRRLDWLPAKEQEGGRAKEEGSRPNSAGSSSKEAEKSKANSSSSSSKEAEEKLPSVSPTVIINMSGLVSFPCYF